MKTLAAVVFAIAFCVPLAACKGKRGEDEASIQKRLNEKGTVDLMDQVSKAPDYQPPADGRLTAKQVEIYLDVRRRELKIREVAFKNLKAKEKKADAERRDVGVFEAMKAVGDVADVATADLRAAQELGYNPKEFSWIKERVLEARMLQTTKALNRQMAEGRQEILEMLEEQRRAATDEAQRAEIERQIEEMKKGGSAAAADSSPAKEHNAELLSRYKDEFDELQAEEQRIAEEVQKGSGSQGGQSGR
jgi:hypothetical protein